MTYTLYSAKRVLSSKILVQYNLQIRIDRRRIYVVRPMTGLLEKVYVYVEVLARIVPVPRLFQPTFQRLLLARGLSLLREQILRALASLVEEEDRMVVNLPRQPHLAFSVSLVAGLRGWTA